VATACVVLNTGAETSAEELIAFCKNIASFKRPRHVLFMQDYPMTASGKVQKFNLRQLAMRALNLFDDDHDG